jgi:site-specific recombinase XerD
MKLLEQFVVVAQRRRLSEHTVECYLTSIREFMTCCAAAHGLWKHPTELGPRDVEAFLNDLVIRRRLSASSQNQALCALAFLYRHVLEGVIPNEPLGKFLLERSRRIPRVPTVLAADEVRRLIEMIPPNRIYRLMAELLYGTGMRVAEACTLRVADIDLGRAQIIVRSGKGDKDRVVMLPERLRERLKEQLDAVERRWRRDVSRGGGYAPVPDSLEHKRPRAGTELRGSSSFHRPSCGGTRPGTANGGTPTTPRWIASCARRRAARESTSG